VHFQVENNAEMLQMVCCMSFSMLSLIASKDSRTLHGFLTGGRYSRYFCACYWWKFDVNIFKQKIKNATFLILK